ncbi:MAG: hypothetical protein M3Z31_12905 [Pseudomonadota bacterium]|nr:hypothetical protein [Pseudomonadota bacterium]
MKVRALALCTFLALAATPGLASAKGCVKGALVGGGVGHLAGHHGVAGAAVGCAVGHHRAKVKGRQDAAPAATTNYDRAAPVNTTTNTTNTPR